MGGAPLHTIYYIIKVFQRSNNWLGWEIDFATSPVNIEANFE